jgi:branched-chain amino acid transport system substrate-binding protein
MLALAPLAVAVAAAACGGGGSQPSTAAPATSAAAPAATTQGATPAASGNGSNVEQPGQCGAPDAQGQKATGEPIKLGAIITKQPGIDFSSISGVAEAYFKCVNDNGGIHGRPIEYVVEYEQTDPQQVAQLAVKLIENEHVLGLVGSTSLIDCTVNHKYYESKGFYVIEAGVPAECFTTPNMAPVNMGPRISMTGIADYAVRHGAKKLVEYNPNNPGVEYYANGPLDYAKAKGIPAVSILGPQVIQDPASEAQRLVQAAGPDGAILIDYVAPETLKILQAASQQGLIDKVKLWAAGGASNDASLISALGPEWNGKFPINAELSNASDTPDNQLLQQIISKYAPDIPISSFAQLGFMAAKFATEALLQLPEGSTLDATTVNEAFRNLKNVHTDILCKNWYFGDLPAHQPINTGRTINIEDGKAVEEEGCIDVPDIGDPVLQAARKAEKELGLNTGG